MDNFAIWVAARWNDLVMWLGAPSLLVESYTPEYGYIIIVISAVFFGALAVGFFSKDDDEDSN